MPSENEWSNLISDFQFTSLRKLPDKFQMSSRKVADLEKTSARLTIHFVNLDDLEFIWPDYVNEDSWKIWKKSGSHHITRSGTDQVFNWFKSG